MKAFLTAASILAVLLLGITHFAQNSGRVELYENQKAALAAELERMRLRTEQAGEVREAAPDCHFVLNDQSYQGDRFLLNECTGDVWCYDRGQGYDSGDNWAQLGPRKWRRVARDE